MLPYMPIELMERARKRLGICNLVEFNYCKANIIGQCSFDCPVCPYDNIKGFKKLWKETEVKKK